MFSNAKNVEINGKTVKSIILENGGVLYEKLENTNYNLNLVSDKNILSSSDNDVATLTATLTENNSPLPNEQVLFYDSDRVSLATYYDWLDVFLFTVTSENQGEIIFDTTNAEHNNFYTEDTTSGGGYSNGGRVKFVITDTQVETWRYNSSTDTWTKSFMLYNLPVKIGFSYGTEIISDTAKIPFFAMGITDSSGECSVGYVGKGTGDLNIKCECMNLQETYSIEDCSYFNDGSSVTDLDIGTGVSCTSNGQYITITTSTSGEKQVWLPNTLNSNDNWLFEVEIADTGVLQSLALNYDDAQKWAGHSINANQWFANSGTNDTYIKAYQVGDKLTIIRENGVDKVILNDNTVISNRSATHQSHFKVGLYTNNGRTQKVKNIKLKPL